MESKAETLRDWIENNYTFDQIKQMAYQSSSGLPYLTSTHDLMEIYDRHKDYLWSYFQGYAEGRGINNPTRTVCPSRHARHVMAEIYLEGEENIKEAIVWFVTKKLAQSIVPEIEIRRIDKED